MTRSDESLITAELQALIGVDGPPTEALLTPQLVDRLRETFQEDQPRWLGRTAPPYALAAFGADLPLPETPAAAIGLLTGDDWTLYRSLQVGERLRVVGRLVSVHERFGSRFGHTLVLRTGWTFTDESGATVAEAGRTTNRYAPPDGDAGRPPRDGERPPDAAEPPGQPEATTADPPFAPLSPGEQPAEGDLLPPLVLRPVIGQIVRYCGLTWNFVPFFFDAEEARRAGLPGTIVPGPFKLALLTRYLGLWAGEAGEVRSVRAAYRRPDRTGRPLTLRGAVTGGADDGIRRLVECELGIETETGARSVAGSGVIELVR